eukprot:UN05110
MGTNVALYHETGKEKTYRLNYNGYLSVIESLCNANELENAFIFLEKLKLQKELQSELRINAFSPILDLCLKSENIDDMMDVFEEIVKFEILPWITKNEVILSYIQVIGNQVGYTPRYVSY